MAQHQEAWTPCHIISNSSIETKSDPKCVVSRKLKSPQSNRNSSSTMVKRERI
uniref:Uncharacterized protein n=1 Tax=Rhinopithecus roxellana TaxID=61622 RepID=A0A2K6NFZ7_RHIRO